MSAPTHRPTDALLVQAVCPDAAALPALLEHLQCAMPAASTRLHAAYAADPRQLYAYLHLSEQQLLERSAAQSLESALEHDFPGLSKVQVSRLEKVFDAPGASAGQAPVFHYVVEMDPESDWMPQLSEWYNTEHMPGLATVPGCIRASRFLNHDHGPLSLACYDLLSEETLGSTPWLAVRGTAWSDRMRPRFTNTLRTMFSCYPIRG